MNMKKIKTRDSMLNKLQKLYDKIPKIECKKMCYKACGPLMMSKREKDLMVDGLGSSKQFNKISKGKYSLITDNNICPALKNNECSLYGLRPLICRLYGTAKGLECQFGCEPERYLTRREMFYLLNEIKKLK